MKKKIFIKYITLNVDGKPQNVLPREIKYHILTDEPTHVDFLRVVPGVKIRIEVPVILLIMKNHQDLKEVVF